MASRRTRWVDPNHPWLRDRPAAGGQILRPGVKLDSNEPEECPRCGGKEFRRVNESHVVCSRCHPGTGTAYESWGADGYDTVVHVRDDGIAHVVSRHEIEHVLRGWYEEKTPGN